MFLKSWRHKLDLSRFSSSFDCTWNNDGLNYVEMRKQHFSVYKMIHNNSFHKVRCVILVLNYLDLQIYFIECTIRGVDQKHTYKILFLTMMKSWPQLFMTECILQQIWKSVSSKLEVRCSNVKCLWKMFIEILIHILLLQQQVTKSCCKHWYAYC